MKKYIINKTIELYRTGEPFHTGAVIHKIPDRFTQNAKISDMEFVKKEKSTVITIMLEDDEKIFGLGEMMGALNKRGKKYVLFATDDPNHTPQKESLYGSHPFIIIAGTGNRGFFIDYPGEMIFDIGFTERDKLVIEIMAHDFDIYRFYSGEMKGIIGDYLALTGEPYVPPKWAFGYQQCRLSYPDKETLLNVADTFRKEKIPCDALYLDLDYMEKCKIFTTNEERFPDFKEMTEKLGKEGFKVIPIIDPGVKIEKGYDIYEDGIANDVFCRDENGEYFEAAVWPGLTHLPDFMNKKTREWWGKKYRKLHEIGIAGYWNDMNEPSIFYTKKALENIKNDFEEIKKEKDSGAKVLNLAWSMGSIANKKEYYSEFYHTDENGNRVNHKDVHNLYGYWMNEGAAQEIVKFNGNKRYFMFSRSSYAGMHRFAGLWTGDNASWWEHILLQMKMMMSLNMSGFLYCGADVGGFQNDVSPELFARWMQVGIFAPLFRNHSSCGTREQEPWKFDEKINKILRDTIRLRYAMMPYYYSEFMNAVKEKRVFISPLFLSYKGEREMEIEDQFMVGKSMMATPVYTQNSHGRNVYLPKHKWLKWNMSSYEKRKYEVMEPGNHYIRADLSEVPVFIKENGLIALAEPQNYIGEKDYESLKVIGFVSKKAVLSIYSDDGESFGYKENICENMEITVKKHEEKFSVAVKKTGAYTSGIKIIEFEIYDEDGKVFKTKKVL